MLFHEVVERIRQANSEVILNLTGGMGGDLVLGPDDAPLSFRSGTDFVGPRERIAHVLAGRDALLQPHRLSPL